MSRFVAKVQALALTLGAPGLFLVTFLDSSFLSLPEIADLMVVWMVIQHKSRLVLYASAATIGSLAGCLALYYVARKGGDALVKKRFGSGRADRALATLQRYGVLAVLIPSLLPPPAPFKIFILLAGVVEIPVARFSIALLIGRGVRYFLEGLLAVWYGEQAIAFIHANARSASLYAVGVVALGTAVYVLWSKARSRRRQ